MYAHVHVRVCLSRPYIYPSARITIKPFVLHADERREEYGDKSVFKSRQKYKINANFSILCHRYRYMKIATRRPSYRAHTGTGEIRNANRVSSHCYFPHNNSHIKYYAVRWINLCHCNLPRELYLFSRQSNIYRYNMKKKKNHFLQVHIWFYSFDERLITPLQV